MTDDETDSSRATMPELGEPLTLAQWPEGDPFAPTIYADDVAAVQTVTGLVCRIAVENGHHHVHVAIEGWPLERYASIDGALWRWLASLERRAAFCRYAVLVPTDRQPRARVWTGIILWD